MRIPSLVRAAALAAALSPVFFAATSARAEDAAKPPSDTVEIVLQDGIGVPDLLRMASEASDVPILWSDQDKVVTMKKLVGARRISVPKAKVFDSVRDLLTSLEIAVVPVGMAGRSVYVAMDARMLANQFLLRMRPEHVEMDDATAARLEGRSGLFIETTIRVQGVENLRDVRTAMARLVTGQNIGNVQEIPSAQALVVTDYAPNVVAIYRFLKALPAKPEPTVEFFLLAHAKPEAVAGMLSELIASKPAPVGPVALDAAVAARAEPLRIVADAASRQVIVSGTAAQVELARKIIARVDVEPATPAGGGK